MRHPISSIHSSLFGGKYYRKLLFQYIGSFLKICSSRLLSLYSSLSLLLPFSVWFVIAVCGYFSPGNKLNWCKFAVSNDMPTLWVPSFFVFLFIHFFLKSIVTLKWDMNIAQISVANNVFEYAFIDQIPFFKIAIEISRNITVFHIYRTCCIILLICLSVSHILQSCVGKHLPISKKKSFAEKHLWELLLVLLTGHILHLCYWQTDCYLCRKLTTLLAYSCIIVSTEYCQPPLLIIM